MPSWTGGEWRRILLYISLRRKMLTLSTHPILRDPPVDGASERR